MLDDAELTNATFPVWMLHGEDVLLKAHVVTNAAPEQFILCQTAPTLADLSVSQKLSHYFL